MPAEGAVCFRPGSQRFVLFFSDSEMHNGPPDGLYEPWGPEVVPSEGALATYPEVVEALVAAGIRVIVIDTWTDTWGQAHDQFETLAADTGAVTAAGTARFELDMSAGPQDLAFVLDVIDELLP